MKCPNDSTEMEKGKTDRGMWVKGDVNLFQKAFVGKPMGINSIWLIVWRCPTCGKIEFYTEPNKG